MCIQWVLLAEALVCKRWKTCLERWDPASLVPYNKHKHRREKDKNCNTGFTQLFWRWRINSPLHFPPHPAACVPVNTSGICIGNVTEGNNSCLKEPWQHLAAASVGERLSRGVRVGFSCVQCVEKGRRGQNPFGIQDSALPEGTTPDLRRKLTESSRSRCLWQVPADEET